MEQLRQIIKSRINNLRKVDHLIHQESFTLVWTKSTKSEKDELSKNVMSGFSEKLNEQIDSLVTKYEVIEELPFKYLREMARDYKIRNYAFMSKSMLISKLIEIKRRMSDAQNGTDQKSNGTHSRS